MRTLYLNIYPGNSRLVIPPYEKSPLRLLFNDEEIVASEGIVLDTGLAADMAIPLYHLPDMLAPDIIGSAVRAPFNGWGGVVKDARSFEAQLQLHHVNWIFDVRVVFSSEFKEWYIGLPILRHFDLLLAEPDPSALPYIARPCLAGRDILP